MTYLRTPGEPKNEMRLGKRKRSSRPSVTRAIATAMRVGNTRSIVAAGRSMYKRRNTGVGGAITSLQRQISSISNSVEVKEAAYRITNVQLPHNNVTVFNNSAGTIFNPFQMGQGAQDYIGLGGDRVGDKIQIKGLLFKFMVEGSLGRSKVYFRFMLIRAAKGDTIDRGTLFKQVSGNKMLDQINTERFTIVAQKTFNVSAPNNTALGLTAPLTNGVPSTATVAGITGNRIFSMYVPGHKFGKGGNITYEHGSSQVKFYDYRLCCVAYDWYGTPQDVNNVGFVNDGFVKLYFKDA